ncbi:4866_t:CDS:2, partial [Entrophospora sp. SA101]
LVRGFGEKLKFCGRDDTFNILWNGPTATLDGIVARFKNRNKRDKSLHPIPILAGGPGVGKKLCNAFTNMIVINTAYGNGSPTVPLDITIGDETSLAIRFYLKIASNPLLVLVLGVDEINKLYDLNKNTFKNLINIIGGTMCDSPENIFIIPILAGTIEGPLDQYIFGSMHEPFFLPLTLLNDDDAIEIGKAMNLFDNEYVHLHPYFRISISDIGGHVKTLEYYYMYFSEKLESEMMTDE